MIADRSKVFEAWRTFQAKAGKIAKPKNEAEYLELLDLMDELTSRYDCNLEPWSSLFGVIATYMHEWELENEPDLKNPQVAPHELLAFVMEQQGLSQYQLEKEGIVDQGLLSNILKGKRKISKELAKKLGERFKLSPSLFL